MQTYKKKAEPKKPGLKKINMKLLDLYDACVKNARELADEASLLLKHGHVARAFTLAYVAYEEIGKSQIVADFFYEMVSQSEFSDAFRNHYLKAAYVRRIVSLSGEPSSLDATIEYDVASARRLLALRNDSLYVGCEGDHSPRLPSDAVSKELVERLIKTVRKELDDIRLMAYATERIGTKSFTK